jgi:hypothetical protein
MGISTGSPSGSQTLLAGKSSINQWEFQDPKMEVLYHIRPYFVGIFPEIKPSKIGLMYGRYLQ